MYQFGPFQLDTSTIRLTKDGCEVEVEPQVFKTLLLLLENRDRVVSKDELLDKIWHDRVVNDSAITRVIYELRKILEVKDGPVSQIRTVRGIGYQFIAKVIETNGAVDKPVQSTAPHAKRSRRTLLWPILIGTLLLIITVWVYLQQKVIPPTPDTQSNKEVYPIVTVLPIEIEDGNQELSMLVQSLIDYLTNQLAINLNMKVIHPDSLASLEGQQDDVWAIQQATHSDFIIQGFIGPVAGQRIKLHLKMYKKENNGELIPFSLGAFEFPYPKNTQELNDLYKQRKVTVRSIIEIIKPGIVVKDNGDYETVDPEAYRLVIAAHHMSRTDNCGDMQRAEQLLLKAVTRDDKFVYAYLQLFTNYYKRVWICGESTDFNKKGLAMAEIIDRLAPNTYQAIAIRRSTLLVESNQVESAYEMSKDADWNDPKALYHQSYILRYAGFLKATSKNLDRILQLDPFFFNAKPIEQAPNTLLYQNRFKEHLALLAEPGNSYHDYFRGLNLFLTKQTDVATNVLQGVVDRTPDDLFGQFSQALLSVIQGDDASAIHVIDAIVKLREVKKHTDGEMTYKLAQLYALAKAPELAIANLQLAVDQGFFPVSYFKIDPALKLIRKEQAFGQIIEQAELRHMSFAKKFNLSPESL